MLTYHPFFHCYRSSYSFFSPYVGNLSFLTKIDLYNNSFHGIIPSEIGRLFRLQILDFTNNSFQDQIPANLSKCANLRTIELYGNSLTGRIPDQLSALSNLQVLGLMNNNFNGNIPRSIGSCSVLSSLILSYNNLSGNIPHELGKLFNLQYLRLSQNKLSGDFPIEIYNISSIKHFWISDNLLTGQFPNTLGLTFPKMQYFFVSANNFSGSIPNTFVNASNLVNIEIGRNMFTGPIPLNLGRLQQLEVLEFDYNPLGIDKNNVTDIITTLTNCTKLVTLDMSNTEISGVGVLPVHISNLSRKLTVLALAKNHISGDLPNGIGDLVGLYVFTLMGNTLSGSIPVSIGNLKNLKELYLSENNFIGEIPPSIGNISGMLTLDLGQNRLTGIVPVILGNLSELQLLSLSGNHLNGSIPKEVFSIKSQLLELHLHQNNFIGSLPSEVGNLKQLIFLSVFGNELSGVIPISIGSCQMLVTLEMQGNFLDGTIPLSIGQLKSIEVMDLSRNKLSGEIPPSLESLKFFRLLNLSFNMLEGEVPNNGVFENTSALSIAGNEKLCGGAKSLNLPLCLPKDSKNHENLSTHKIIILVICIILALFFLFGYGYAIYQKGECRVLSSKTHPLDTQLHMISYAEILTSTKVFSSENLIGEGKYGFVYRGVIKPDERVVAIKVLKLHMKGPHKSFLAECEALKNIRHRNLVKVITSCSSIDFKGNDFKALILEYFSNGSLEEWLHTNAFVQVNEKKLDILERLNIAIDIATALDYLHNHSGNPIVHRYIKPNNILLGDDLRGMVTDFGLAKFIPTVNDISHDIESTSIGIRGTIGYVAPEYGIEGDVSTKGDIYSYGILLLEMFTGKRPTDNMFTEDISLHNYVKTALDQRVAEIIDPKLWTMEDNKENRSNYTSTRIVSCCSSIFHVGVSCSSELKNNIMNICDALIELQHVRNELYDPRQAEFLSLNKRTA